MSPLQEEQVRFADYDPLVWGLLVLALFWGFLWLAWWRNKRLADLGRVGPLPSLLDSNEPAHHWVRATLVLFGAALLVLSLMRLQYGSKETKIKHMGIDIAVALDLSKSMRVRDVLPDRLEAATLEIHRLLDNLHGGRVALIPFSGLAFIQTPLTSDFQVVKTYLGDLRIEDMPRGGTAIGPAILEAIRALIPPDELPSELREDEDARMGKRRERGAQSSDDDKPDLRGFEGSKHKAIILITDGEDHEGEPLQAAQIAADLGIPIYTVGVGTSQGRPVPILNATGQQTGTMTAADGKTPLFSGLNMELLESIAKATKGRDFHLGPEGMTDGLLAAIDKLEKREFDATHTRLGADRYQWTLIPALLLLLLEALLGSRRLRFGPLNGAGSAHRKPGRAASGRGGGPARGGGSAKRSGADRGASRPPSDRPSGAAAKRPGGATAPPTEESSSERFSGRAARRALR